MSPDLEFQSVINAAIASDGGTILIALADKDGNGAAFKINRSLRDRGTPAYNRVSGEHGELTELEADRLLGQLQGVLAATEPCSPYFKLLETFVSHLKAKGL
jgi:hypothetical protein